MTSEIPEKTIKAGGNLTPQDIVAVGEKDSKYESPIDLNFNITTEIILPSLQWNNASEKPRLMKITNSGQSVILSAKWFGPRPFLCNGPFMGYYIFSQVHFHWGAHELEGSEHTIEGKALPLEIHVMFFKSMYLAQEEAMKKIDGVTVLAYLLKLNSTDNVSLKPMIDALDNIKNPFTSQHIDLLSLNEFLPLFTDDYFLYWGNVATKHKILWLICRQPLTISSNQLSKFRKLLDENRNPMKNNFRQIKSLNFRKVFHVNPGLNKAHILFLFPHELAEERLLHEEKDKSPKKKQNKAKKSIKPKHKGSVSGKRKSQMKIQGSGVPHEFSESAQSQNTTMKPDEMIIQENIITHFNKEKEEILPYLNDDKLKILEGLLNNDLKMNPDNKNNKKPDIPILSKVEEFLRNALQEIQSKKNELELNENINSAGDNDFKYIEQKEEQIKPIIEFHSENIVYPVLEQEIIKQEENINNELENHTMIKQLDASLKKNNSETLSNGTAEIEEKSANLRPRTAGIKNDNIKEMSAEKVNPRKTCGRSLYLKRRPESEQNKNKKPTVQEILKNKMPSTTGKQNKNCVLLNTTKDNKSKKPVWKY